MNGMSMISGKLGQRLGACGTCLVVLLVTSLVTADARADAAVTIQCNRNITAEIVALDMPLMFNRLGAQNVNGMMYALKRDVVTLNGFAPIGDADPATDEDLSAHVGNVTLRPDKRPRPLVLRTGRGDCLTIKLTNLLKPVANPFDPASNPVVRSGVDFEIYNDDQVAARNVSLRFQGTELVNSIADDGTLVGQNFLTDDGALSDAEAQLAMARPGQTVEYTVYTPHDGAYLGVSYGSVVGGEGLGGPTASGLWAVLNVNAEDAVFYRSQVTNEELELVSTGVNAFTGHPEIDYDATYPPVEPWVSEGKAGAPILNMIDTAGNYVHTEIDAIIAYGGFDDSDFRLGAPTNGPHVGNVGFFPADIYPLEAAGKRNPTVPNRMEPFREFTVAFHDETQTTQVFPKWFNDPVLRHTLHGVRDTFMINYGSGGIGSEIIANRLGVGPMHDCVNCAYEEFFLTFHAVGEVGQVTDIPANMGLEDCDPTLANCGAVGPKANYVLYPGDPSNIHHSYVGDSTAFRNLHAGPGEQHVFHLHNHQWLFNANDDNSNYLDAQGLGPGAGYAYWINFGGSGNRNKTAGDAIFHCHFYPHFAQGMWEMWRIHDAFEPGTTLEVSAQGIDADGDGAGDWHESFAAAGPSFGIGIGNGTPAIDDVNNRALPDGELIHGAPTPGVIPLPGRALAPMPAEGVSVRANDNKVDACFVDGDVTKATMIPDAATGACPAGSSLVAKGRPVGSLTVVDRGAIFNGPGRADDVTPGYPFWIAGMEDTVGNRPPTPPLDMITSAKAASLSDADGLWGNPGWGAENAIDGWDGGLPRFAVQGFSAGGEAAVAISRLDMSKEVHAVKPVFFPEEGTDLEQVAMYYHAQRCHDSARLAAVDAEGSVTYELLECPDVGSPHDSSTQTGFLTNGSLPIAGAPFQDPCIDDSGVPTSGTPGKFFGGQTATAMWDGAGMTTTGASPYNGVSPRVYKAANVQFDAVLNKLGYHFPQQRIIALWQDVVPTINQERPPEPFVLRMNTFDCTQYVHSNVVPKAYELDDYQVRTPTDIIGQHIHLPKWDLTSADGSANGWNYEDGTLSPGAVVELIHAINNYNHHAEEDPSDAYEPVYELSGAGAPGLPVVNSAGEEAFPVDPVTGKRKLHALPHPFFGQNERGDNCAYGTEDEWCGARSTLQRWFADPVVNVQGVDRGLGIVFTHDHYGPSTHQQVGLYATVLIEPSGSKWKHNETGVDLYTRTCGEFGPCAADEIPLADGGPTSWQAAILTGENAAYVTSTKAEQIKNFREFYFEYTDFQHAYQPGVYVGRTADGRRIGPNGELAEYNGEDLDGNGLIDNMILSANPETFRQAIQPPVRKQAGLDETEFPLDIWEFPNACPGNAVNPDGTNTVPRPCPEAITADDPGMYVVNYRNESLLARVYDPNKPGPDANGNDCSSPDNRSGCGTQADGRAGDLAFAFDTNTTRAIAELNTAKGLAPDGYFSNDPRNKYCDNGVGGTAFCPPINSGTATAGGDPFTPIMRVMDGDDVKVKMQAGGQEEEFTGTLYGLKWLQGGSGFGEAKNSGWRNAQAGGISEQFALKMPVYADYNQRGGMADYLYSFNTSIDGWASGSWGILRTYNNDSKGDLWQLPGNEVSGGIRMANASDYSGVCPRAADVRAYDITAVTVNNILDTPANVSIQDLFPDKHVGQAPRGDGGSLVYNDRTNVIDGTDELVAAVNGSPLVRQGPIHDPTGMIYVETEKLESALRDASTPDTDPYCWRAPLKGNKWKYDPSLPSCDVKLRNDAPLEPVVIRAAAGECVDVTLNNKVLQQAYEDVNDDGVYTLKVDYKLFQADGKPAFEDKRGKGPQYELAADTNFDGIGDVAPSGTVRFNRTLDLANTNAISAAVRRDPGDETRGMTSFNNNLLQPSAHVGMYPQLLELDVTRSAGMNVGQNPSVQTAVPGGQVTYRWYAGHIGLNVSAKGRKAEGTLVATPIEFGGFGITPADPIEQGQKGLYGAGAVYPAGTSWSVDAGGTTEATVRDAAGNPLFRDFTNVAAKGASIYYANSFPVENILGEGSFGVAEDAQGMGGMAINYGNEAMWLRYGRNPTVAAGNALCTQDGAGANPDECLGGVGSDQAMRAYHNTLADIGEDPQTAVFDVKAGQQFRMHVLMPFGSGRGSTFDLHGHVWPRDPYICDGDEWGIAGKCPSGDGLPGSGVIGSQKLGVNPLAMYLGGIESWFPGQHYEVFIPSAGGTGQVDGDYLFRDHMGLGNTGGLWGVVRVEPAAQ